MPIDNHLSQDDQRDKHRLRAQGLQARDAQPEKDALSRRIVARCLSLPEYERARVVLWYVDVRTEVRTRPALPTALASGKRIVVPWCSEEHKLELFHLAALHELAPGRYGVLEPRAELRSLPERRVKAGELDFVITPGVVFDRWGGRLGYGAGYYDRLLAGARPEALIAGLAFDCQVVDAVPMGPGDVFLDRIVTETTIHEGSRRRGAAS